MKGLGAGLLGLALSYAACLATSGALAPFESLASGAVLLYVGDCPSSLRALHELEAAPEAVRTLVVPVPVRSRPELEARLCARTTAFARRHGALWPSLLPERLACRWLVAGATRFNDRTARALPALSLGHTPIAPEGQAVVLARLGILLREDAAGMRFGALDTHDADAEDEPSPPPGIRHDVGW